MNELSSKSKGKQRADESVNDDGAGDAMFQQPVQQQRRSTRSTNPVKDAANSGDEADDEDALLPRTTGLLLTTDPPPLVTLFETPELPIGLQALIEVPESRPIAYGELPRVKTTAEPGHQRDFSDEYYARRHLAGETLEKRGRKQERDRLIQDRNKLRTQYEHLKSELASVAYYASASPLKGVPKTAVPINSEKLKETERLKKKQLQQTEDTLRRYEELLEPSRTHAACRYFGHWRENDTIEWGSGAHMWTTGGKGIPPAPPGIAAEEYLRNPAPQPSTSAAPLTNAQRKLAAARSAEPSNSSAPKSRSASPAVSSLPPAYSTSLSKTSSSAGRTNNIPKTSSNLSITIKPLRRNPPSVPEKPAISSAPPTWVAIAPRPSNDAKPAYDHNALAVNGERHPHTAIPNTSTSSSMTTRRTRNAGRPSGTAPLSNMNTANVNITYAAQPQSDGASSTQMGPDGSPIRKRRRRRRGNESEDDDGAKEALALMNASKEFLDEYTYGNGFGPYLGLSPNGHLPPGASTQSEADDGDTDNGAVGQSRQLRKRNTPMTKEERAKYWDYRGPPTIKDSFFRTAAAAHAAVQADSPTTPIPPPSPTTPGFAIPSGALTTFAFGHKLPALAIDTQQEFSPISALPADVVSAKGITVPQSAPPIITKAPVQKKLDKPPSLPKILIERAPGTTGRTGALSARLSRAPSTRQSTPLPGLRQADKNRRPPRHFRPPPLNLSNINGANTTLQRKAVLTATAAKVAEDLFDSEGELSSVSSDLSDTENQDSDTRFRTERATRILEPGREEAIPAFLVMPSPGVTGSAKSAAVNGYFDSKRGQASRTATPEPLVSSEIQIVNGMRVRKRIRLDEFPTNELEDLNDDEMAMLRRSYEHVGGRRVEALGPAYKEKPLGEWQIKMDESFIRGS